jgi:hypothetical protein
MTPWERLQDQTIASPASLVERLAPAGEGGYAEAPTPTSFVGEVEGWVWNAVFTPAYTASKARCPILEFDETTTDHQFRHLTNVGYRALDKWERERKSVVPGGIEPIGNEIVNRCGFQQVPRSHYLRALSAMNERSDTFLQAVLHEAKERRWTGIVKRAN